MQLGALADLVGATVTAQAVAPGGPTMFVGERGSRRVALEEYLGWLTVLEAAFPSREELAQRLRLLYYPTRYSDLLVTNVDLAALPAGSTAEVRDAWEALLHAGYVLVPVGAERLAVRITPLWAALDATPRWASMETVLSWQGLSTVGYLTWQGELCRVVDEWLLRRLRNPTQPQDETAANVPAGMADWLTRAVAQQAPREDLRGAIDALLLADWARREPATPVSALLARYYAFGPAAPGQPSAATRLDALISTDPSARQLQITRTEPSVRLLVTSGLTVWAMYYQRDRRGSHLDRFLGASPAERRPWFNVAVGALADLTVATLMHADQWRLPTWPAQPDPLYGGYDLGPGDDDTSLTYGGTVRAADPGGHVARLVADLTTAETAAPAGLGFDGVLTDPNTRFGERLALLVREFQIEASQRWMWGRTAAGVWGRHPAYRRYRGRITGIVDWETRRSLQLWLSRPDFATANATDPPTELAAAGLSQVGNGLRVFSADPADHTTNATGNWWWWDDEQSGGPRVYARDRLQRRAVPVVDQLAADPEVVALGGWTNNPFAPPPGGPVLVHDRGTWQTALLRMDRLEALNQFLSTVHPFRHDAESTYAVVYAMSAPEISGCLDSYTGWDVARMSFGLCHWTLRLEQLPVIRGELASLLAWHRDNYPASYRDDFASWGVDVDPFAALPVVAPGKVVGPVKVWGASRDLPYASAGIPGGSVELLEWFRSWRSVFRILGALRGSDDLLRSVWRLARRRLRLVLAEPWSADPARNTDITDPAGDPATFGEVVNSEAGAAALLRWHINQPGRVFPPGAVESTVQDAVRHAAAAAGFALPRPAAMLAASDPFAAALATALADPARPAAGTVNAAGAVNATIPDLANRKPSQLAASFRLWSVGT